MPTRWFFGAGALLRKTLLFGAGGLFGGLGFFGRLTAGRLFSQARFLGLRLFGWRGFGLRLRRRNLLLHLFGFGGRLRCFVCWTLFGDAVRVHSARNLFGGPKFRVDRFARGLPLDGREERGDKRAVHGRRQQRRRKQVPPIGVAAKRRLSGVGIFVHRLHPQRAAAERSIRSESPTRFTLAD